MQKNEWAYALTIAGFDPSGGAGLLADTKTMEQHQVYALNVCTALTVQNDSVFEDVFWQDFSLIRNQLILLIRKFPVKICKIGLVQNWFVLEQLIDLLKSEIPAIKIVLDPIFRASAGFQFHEEKDLLALEKLLQKIYLITPNLLELEAMADRRDRSEVLKIMQANCNILLKGGHSKTEKGTDYLYWNNEVIKLEPKIQAQYEKHGSGCVLSAAITANLAKGKDLITSCQEAKIYIANFLNSNPTLLGYHNL